MPLKKNKYGWDELYDKVKDPDIYKIKIPRYSDYLVNKYGSQYESDYYKKYSDWRDYNYNEEKEQREDITNEVAVSEREKDLDKQAAKLLKDRERLAEDARKLEEERKQLAADAKKFAEEKAEVEREKAKIEAAKKALHDKRHEESDLSAILEPTPPSH